MTAHYAGILNCRQETMLGILDIIIVATISLMVAVGAPSFADSGF